MTGNRDPGLRERKKRATREALRTAALRLALEHGPEQVRVDDIARAAGVSPRTYNNYFSSREEAIVAAVLADRDARVAGAVASAPAGIGLAEAVIEAVVAQYTDPPGHGREFLRLLANSPHLRACYADAASSLEEPLAEAIAARAPDAGGVRSRVLAAGVAAAVRVAVRAWITPAAEGLVVATGSLPDGLRAALAVLAPALDAAERPPR
ncbi:TetR/AcrR family transcriptional regulator [Streptomyces profundus]|uniref:TetR/AcrR family transcriptional regulator n=1 Tax=Streptomyces profundus TaxID=2867410 RepID=UPI001D162FBB|nr:TetR/AcrR family transcriptional regulator [Streptomyces sp. MA3_2.13]UED85136.1 TetR/AcrR family transcriptional regulator [Streptomyces sp. MA3_2.13]